MSNDNIEHFIISPGNDQLIYQELAKTYSAIEPPIWAGLLAQYTRREGYSVEVVDQVAEGLSASQIADRVTLQKPKLITIVAYGHQPSASTQNMTAAYQVCEKIKEAWSDSKILLVGGHVSALPQVTLEESKADWVCQGESVLTIGALLKMEDFKDENQLLRVPGLWFWKDQKVVSTSPAPLISEKELPNVLAGMAWDLLPMHQYRAHNWHCFDDIDHRMPYASIYTSLGCPFKCSFCCIQAPFGNPSIRYWNPAFIIQELDILATRYGVKNLKIADEMFVLHEKHVLTLCDLIVERGYTFNIWAYARVDTVRDHFLEKLQKAGVKWLALGIESASHYVRDGVQKGRFKEEDIYKIVKKIKDAGIYVLGNYIFGLPDDDYDSMQHTLDVAIELNCEWANFYSAMAYPGSKLYPLAKEKGWALPSKWHDFSQHSFEQLPLPTEKLSAGEVLHFRDKAWQVYFENPKYQAWVLQKFGPKVAAHVKEMTQMTLKRKYHAPLLKEPRGHSRGVRD
ncbi:MAG: cobalamin B12-binding domain-containing protein [Deltaproteobacteria bacterium]|nr:cobalamin B12-binding domain-containing protein [Deltaproteobacteria bacterium]